MDMQITDGPTSWYRNTGHADNGSETIDSLRPEEIELAWSRAQNPWQAALEDEPVDPSEQDIATSVNDFLDALISDRWVFKFSFGENQEIIAEIIDSETGDIIKQLSFNQDPSTPLGTIVDIRI